MTKVLLGVNIDHIATIRNARGVNYPDPTQAAFVCEQAGADVITVHLREDRRHITDRDLYILRDTIQTSMNLEIAVTEEMIKIASNVKPRFVCLVPENRQEITTEGGLNVINQQTRLKEVIQQLKDLGILVSLFIDPDYFQIEAALNTEAEYIEIHTGSYANATGYEDRNKELKRIIDAVNFAANFNKFKINAGHGLNYYNVKPIASIPKIHELNIGHSIIARSLFIGLDNAVKEMKYLIQMVRY